MTKFDGRKEFAILPCVLDAGIPDQQSTLGVNQVVNLCFELAPGWRISGSSQVQLDARQGQSFAKVYCFILHLELLDSVFKITKLRLDLKLAFIPASTLSRMLLSIRLIEEVIKKTDSLARNGVHESCTDSLMLRTRILTH